MDITIKRIDELERYSGERQPGQEFYYAGRSLGVSAWGMNIIRMPAGWQDYPEHDHQLDGQEEVYIVLAGSGTLHAGDRHWTIEPGVLVRVGPTQPRKIIPGREGMTLLALGGTPGQAYQTPSRGTR